MTDKPQKSFLRRWWWKVLLLLIIGLLFNKCSYYSLPSYGTVVDLETGEPIADAIVVTEWKGSTSNLLRSFDYCYHIETARTDKNGKFYISAWYGYFNDMIFNKHAHTEAFKVGYTGFVHNKDKPEYGRSWIDKITGSQKEYLVKFTGLKYKYFPSSYCDKQQIKNNKQKALDDEVNRAILWDSTREKD